MDPETKTFLSQQRAALNRVQTEYTANNSMTFDNAKRLCYVYENGLKAPIVEHFYYNVPRKFRSHDLTTLCQSYGVWAMMPSSLQVAIQDMNPFSEVQFPTEPAFKTLVESSNTKQWDDRIEAAKELLNFVEYQVITDPTNYSRLTF